MSFCILCRSYETNLTYVIDDGMLVAQNAKGEFKLNKSKVEAAKSMQECLPASEFPEGNWGDVCAGFQLSLRFETNVFVSGVPINAALILRNVTNTVLSYQATGILGRSSPIAVVVTDTNGANLPLKSDNIAVISTRNIKLFPGTEHKFNEQIDALYNFPTNGLVNAYATLKIRRRSDAEVKSSMVQIQVVN